MVSQYSGGGRFGSGHCLFGAKNIIKGRAFDRGGRGACGNFYAGGRCGSGCYWANRACT